MLLAGKLFRICQPESFWQPSGRKDSKIQDRRAISGKDRAGSRTNVLLITENSLR